MKKLIEISKIIGLSVGIGGMILLLTANYHFSCSALDAFSGVSSFGTFFIMAERLLTALGIWFVGLIAFFVIKKKRAMNLFAYFALLTAIALHSFIITAIKRPVEDNKAMKQAICAKASDDGMTLTFTNLTTAEYALIDAKQNWFPIIPKSTESIDIQCFKDGRDFHLIIDVSLHGNAQLDSITYPSWVYNDGKYRFEAFEI